MSDERPGYLSGTYPFPERWQPVFRELVHRLVLRDYDGLARDGSLGTEGSDPANFGTWIANYPDELVDLPDDPWKYSSFVPTDDPHTSLATIELWTEHQSPSDLTLEATVWDDGESAIVVKAHDAHVL